MRGKLVTFEGIDGSGKSTQAQILRDKLTAEGREVRLLREPGGTELGDLVRSILLREDLPDKGAMPGEDNSLRLARSMAGWSSSLSDIGRVAEFLLFSAARAELVRQVLEPLLQRDAVVILDRFTDSSVAYQGYGRGVDRVFIDSVNNKATGGLKPDLTLLLDIDPTLATVRIKRGLDRMEVEGTPFLERVREGYLKLAAAEPGRIRLINGTQSVEVVSGQIENAVRGLLKG